MEPSTTNIREELHLFTRSFGMLNASCCDQCCGEQVSMTQSHILYEIRRSTNPAMQIVAEELGMDITTFSRQAKSLERNGLIYRTVSPEDRRVTLLHLTEQGSGILLKIDQYMTKQLEQIFSRMSDFERDTVIRSLGLLNRTVAQSRSNDSPNALIACCN
jgi:DNA-binding MarR family transcriptional regulator